MSSLVNVLEADAVSVHRFESAKAMADAAVKDALAADDKELCDAAYIASLLLRDGGFIAAPERLEAAIAKVRGFEVPASAGIEAAL